MRLHRKYLGLELYDCQWNTSLKTELKRAKWVWGETGKRMADIENGARSYQGLRRKKTLKNSPQCILSSISSVSIMWPRAQRMQYAALASQCRYKTQTYGHCVKGLERIPEVTLCLLSMLYFIKITQWNIALRDWRFVCYFYWEVVQFFSSMKGLLVNK